jgi:23S rRNA (uracil1939-C5)-methyltransferase
MLPPLLIESVAYLGSGVARHDGCVHFIPGTCPGELVEAKVTKIRKTFREAELVSVLKPSADRLAAPDCLVDAGGSSIPVPGCVYGHVTHNAELGYKLEQLASFLKRQAKLENVEKLPIGKFASSKPLNYRNRIKLHYGTGKGGEQLLGYIGEDNFSVVDMAQCPLAVPEINEKLASLREDEEFWKWVSSRGVVSLRWTGTDGVVVSSGSSEFFGTEKLSLTEKIPVFGSLKVPLNGFFQVNPEVGAALVSHITDTVTRCAPDELIDFYCGVGVYGLSASKMGVPKVSGFDSGRDVIRAANSNAGMKKVRASFYCKHVGKIARRVLKNISGRKSMAIVNPPRSGLDRGTLDALIASPVENLLYVSCAPDTLSRDLAVLCGAGGSYHVISADIFDMFPRTAYFETVIHMVKTRTK